jgi:hypothetical protein
MWSWSFSLQAQYASNSVLGQGKWYKIATKEGGLYQLGTEELRRLGIETANLNPRFLRLYGHRNGMLPQANNAPKIDDLEEMAIWVQGEEDGRWDSADRLLFYAQPADAWRYDAATQRFIHEKNLYSDENFYFLHVGNAPGLRVATQESLPAAAQSISHFDDYLFYEPELFNILNIDRNGGSGRFWYGDRFDLELQRTYRHPLEGLLPGSPLVLTSAVMGQFYGTADFSLAVNGQNIGTQILPTINRGTYEYQGANQVQTFVVNVNDANFELRYSLNRNGQFRRAYLDYYRIQYKRNLRLYGQSTAFRSIESLSSPSTEYVIGNSFADIELWDISTPLQPRRQAFQQEATQLRFRAASTSLREFLLWRNGVAYPVPRLLGAVANQDLHGVEVPNMVIVTAPDFWAEAERLAAFRRSHDGLQVLVVSPQQIYNEFSAGRQDISAIRNFLKMLYDRQPDKLRYLLLFGAASFDYKDRVPNNRNLVPVYESRESLHPIYSYSSDDYFGFLEDHEGEWIETIFTNNPFDHTLEIGIGRLPVKNTQEAAQMVDKVIHYSTSPQKFGAWRNWITFVADDADFNLHQRDANNLSLIVENNHPQYNLRKIYLDAFPQALTPAGEQSPETREAIRKAMEQGSLILNYTGHGGEVGWAEEAILRMEDIKAWRNRFYPLMITATCEFGRYDEPGIVSGAEEALLLPQAGAIALITTTRPVFSSTNFLTNQQVYQSVFTPLAGEMPRLGDIMRFTKNNSLSGSVNRNFALLGDPSLRLAYPQEQVQLTHINDLDIALFPEQQDTLKALEPIRLKGEIRNAAAQKQGQFNGQVQVTVFDKPIMRRTFGTEGAPPFNFESREVRLFNGLATVKDGTFELSFIPPRNMLYAFGKGKVSFYAFDEARQTDAGGSYQDLVVGGSAQNILPEDQAPQVQLFMNDESFRNGGLVGNNPTFLARIFDESGISISSVGIGQDIVLYLNDSLEQARILNEYYTADLDTYQSGTVRYPLRDIPAGKHRLHFRVWDVHNNLAESEIDFVVADNRQMALQAVMNYPNPFQDKTTFQIEHNRAGEDLLLEIQIFDRNGAWITSLQADVSDSNTRLDQLQWDGSSAYGQKVGSGMYIYKVVLKSRYDGATVSTTQRLIFIKD